MSRFRELIRPRKHRPFCYFHKSENNVHVVRRPTIHLYRNYLGVLNLTVKTHKAAACRNKNRRPLYRYENKID
jgi:hypothetical protein